MCKDVGDLRTIVFLFSKEEVRIQLELRVEATSITRTGEESPVLTVSVSGWKKVSLDSF